MDHNEATQRMAVERYLLDEFGPEEREAFEEHFFSCSQCAQEVREAAALIENAKAIFAREKSLQARSSPAPAHIAAADIPKRDWFAWLRPSVAVPAFALLLVVVGFQNLVQLPALERSLTAMNSPLLLPSAYLASGSSRGEEHVITAKAGQPVLLLIDIPGPANTAYVAELYDASGGKEWSLAIPEGATKESLPLRIPATQRAGSYSLVVRQGGAAAGAEVARYAFTLERQ
jgi:hypothetical protein